MSYYYSPYQLNSSRVYIKSAQSSISINAPIQANDELEDCLPTVNMSLVIFLRGLSSLLSIMIDFKYCYCR